MNKEKQGLLVDVFKNRKLVWSLSKNDIRTQFAGSYLGIAWAFVKPIVTVLVYWFVFQVAMPAPPVGNNVPYVLWLVAGLVPWFFFMEALPGGTSAFLDYNYLVKKVVFNINVLPFVKVLAAVFTHLVFIGFVLIVSLVCGMKPDLYWLQIVYYSFALFMLVLSLSYITSSVLVFFRDLLQMINVLLQIGIWITPILWNMETTEMPEMVKMILKLNPLYYIVQGYRNSLIYKRCFFEDLPMTVYFWVLVICLYFLGEWMFKRLKPHFADVL